MSKQDRLFTHEIQLPCLDMSLLSEEQNGQDNHLNVTDSGHLGCFTSRSKSLYTGLVQARATPERVQIVLAMEDKLVSSHTMGTSNVLVTVVMPPVTVLCVCVAWSPATTATRESG